MERSAKVVRPGGKIVSIAAPVPEGFETTHGVEAVFFLAEVNFDRLHIITEHLTAGELATQVGSILTLDDAAAAHEMLAGAPHKRGKIVLNIAS